MMQIDARVPDETIVQFASQVAGMKPQVRNFMAESLVGDQTPEFYAGLAAGLAAGYQYAGTGPGGQEFIGLALATVADHIVRQQKPT